MAIRKSMEPRINIKRIVSMTVDSTRTPPRSSPHNGLQSDSHQLCPIQRSECVTVTVFVPKPKKPHSAQRRPGEAAGDIHDPKLVGNSRIGTLPVRTHAIHGGICHKSKADGDLRQDQSPWCAGSCLRQESRWPQGFAPSSARPRQLDPRHAPDSGQRHARRSTQGAADKNNRRTPAPQRSTRIVPAPGRRLLPRLTPPGPWESR